MTARALTELPAGWTVLHDMVWPGRRGARIDHVVIGPSGIYVISSQAWSGTVSVEDDVLREDGRPRERAVASAAEAALQVGQMSSRLAITQPMICFATAESVNGRSREVVVCSTGTLVDVLISRPQVLNAGQVRQVAGEVQEQFRAAEAAAGPVIPGQRRAIEDTPRPIAAPPALGSEPRIRIVGLPHRSAAGRSAAGRSEQRDRESRDRVPRFALPALMITALAAAAVFADDLGALLARLLT
ncbi:MAG: nuclease-related domain-containing protein [Nocardioides sp.]